MKMCIRDSHLGGYAVMASILARSVYGKPMPKVGVMSNGSEDEKGTDFKMCIRDRFR